MLAVLYFTFMSNQLVLPPSGPEMLHSDWRRGITLATAILPEMHMDTLVTEASYIARHHIVDNGTSPLNQYFDWCRMTEKSMRAGAGSIGTGLENYHQVTRMGDRQFHPVGEQVERSTQWTDHVRAFAFDGSDPAADGYRVVLANDLAEVARC